MSATTYRCIVDSHIRQVEAIVPQHRKDVPFRSSREESQFETWATANPAAAFRRFTIRHNFDAEAPAYTDTVTDLVIHTASIIVAYPMEMAKYGSKNMVDLDVMLDRDSFAIDDAIGQRGYSNFPDGLHDSKWQSSDVDEIEKVRFLRITYLLQYDRSV